MATVECDDVQAGDSESVFSKQPQATAAASPHASDVAEVASTPMWSRRLSSQLTAMHEELIASSHDGVGSRAFRVAAARLHACVLLSATEGDLLVHHASVLLDEIEALAAGRKARAL